MQDDKKIIYEFLEQFEDFTQADRESGYKNVYRPSWHENPFQFWFNPPFDESGKSQPTLSGAIALLEDGTVMIENVRDHFFYDLNDCVGDSELSLILSIKDINQ